MTTPETTNYMILGYVVFTAVMVLYLLSFYIRNRNLKQDIELLKDLEKEE
jgi:hypothetical protein